MEEQHEEGVFLTFKELKVLFPRLKGTENTLSPAEREVLLRIERTLYGRLSIQEVEGLLKPL
ncbi:MAG: hypothetical protein LBD74_06040 [Spirochaetaceae bacterium]|jgi:hypothetical protein|nr:hypothetical protein [Spirochaetaceae bacterium]